MANSRAGNSIFMDTAGVADSRPNTRLLGIIIHCTHASTAAVVKLADNNSGRSYPVVMNIEIPAANDYAHINLADSPIAFPNGVYLATITNAEITLILDRNAQ